MQKLHYHKILLALFLLAAGTAVAQGRWHGDNMPGARKGLNAVVLGDKIWILGGSRGMHDQLNTVDIYDPASDQWQSSGPTFQNARENATARVFDGRIYLFGGRSGSRIIPQVEMFDPNAGYWQTVAQMSSPRFGLTSVVVDSAIWLIGGTLANNTSSPRVDIYYPASNRWEQGPDLTSGRSSAMAALIKGSLYVFGGFFFGPIASYEKYNPDPGQWQSVGDMPEPMAGSGYAADSSTMWLAGGMSSSGMTDKVMQFNGDGWTVAASLSRAKSECAAVLFENKLYVFGGQSGHMMGNMVEDAVEVFEVTTSVQQRTDALPERFVLMSAYPNPFSLNATISISLPQQDQVDIRIYDIIGRRIGQLYHGYLPQGQHAFAWTALDASGAHLPAGTYFVRLQGERFRQTQKLFIVY